MLQKILPIQFVSACCSTRQSLCNIPIQYVTYYVTHMLRNMLLNMFHTHVVHGEHVVEQTKTVYCYSVEPHVTWSMADLMII